MCAIVAIAVAAGSLTGSTAHAAAPRPDLVVKSLSGPPAQARPGESFSVSAVVRNAGKAKAKASSTTFFLSRDKRPGGGDLRIGTQRVPALRHRGGARRVTALRVPSLALVGIHFVLGCADSGRSVRERSERNNCRAAAAPLQVVPVDVPGGPGEQTPPPGGPGPGPPTPPPPDATAPTAPLVAVSGLAHAVASGTTVHFRPIAGAGFTLAATAADAESGIARVTFPDLGAGWAGGGDDGTAPYATSYAFGGSASTVTRQVTATNGAGLVSPSVTVEAIPDAAAPATTATCDGAACQGPYDGPVTLRLAATDAGAGVDEIRYTVDGTDPARQAGTRYTAPVGLTGATELRYRAYDRVGNEEPVQALSVNVGAPDPADLAPPVDQTVATGLADATRFLYEGDDAPQEDVQEGAIEPLRVGVIRGEVRDRSGEPLEGVRIAVLDHPELGRTDSRARGGYDLAVNGGGPVVIMFERDGYLPVQRTVDVGWNDWAVLDPVVMIEVDAAVTTIDGDAAEMQVARGSEVRDADGERRSTLLFPAGTTAEMDLPDGSERPLGELDVRATEYTVGETGPETMPGQLPATSAYTYAAELSVDQARAARATEVRFSRPVLNYLENYLGFPTGTRVPVGYYDRERGQWVPMPDGRVIEVEREIDGRAELDTDGDNDVDTPDELAALGIGNAERVRVAALYEPGQTLWRVPLEHFSPVDYNWPYGPPDDADPPNQPDPKPDPRPDCQNEQSGSIIGCEGQTLGESLGLTGSGFGLRYQSERTPGRLAARRLEIPLTGPRVPASLRHVELEILVAGQRFTRRFAAAPNQRHTFTWDGKDAYGRTVQGSQPVTTRVGYAYGVVYKASAQLQAASFSRLGRGAISFFGRAGSAGDIVSWQTWRGKLGAWDARGQGLGGWTLDVHHAYDPTARTLYTGDGQRRSADELDLKVIDTFAGNGTVGYSGDGDAATKAGFHNPRGIAAGPDGSLYIAEIYSHRVRRVKPDGLIETVAGNGVTSDPPPAESPRPATAVRLSNPSGVATAPDGSLYVTHDNGVLSRVRPDGMIVRVTGSSGGFGGDGGPANQAKLHSPEGVAATPDGSVYVADTQNNRVRHIGPDGVITTLAGGALQTPEEGDGGPAADAHLSRPFDVAVGPDGSVFIATMDRIRRVGPDGIISTVAGNRNGRGGDGTPATEQQLADIRSVDVGPDGSLYIGEWTRGVRRVRPDGTMIRLTDSVGSGPAGDEGPARRARVGAINGVALGPDGSLFISESSDFFAGAANRIRRIASSLPGLGLATISLAAEDGSELYIFGHTGRHLRTVDALTGTLRHRFTYDHTGRLETVEDEDGSVTRIERNGDGAASAVIAPGGQRTDLAVNSEGYLRHVANPADEAVELDYTADGLLTSLIDPKGGIQRFTYDDLGRLIKDEDPAGGSKTLTRTDTQDGYKVSIRTALGRTSTYELEHLPTGDLRRTVIDASGTRAEAVIGRNGTTSVTSADGTQLSQESGPDPRFGMQAPFTTRQVVTTPSGLVKTTLGERVVTRERGAVRQIVERVKVNGRLSTSLHDAQERTLTSTTPGGHTRVISLDASGRIVADEQAKGILPITYTYDGRGRVSKAEQGGHSLSYAYDSRDRVASVTDVAGRTVGYSYDAADRVTRLTLASGNAYRFAYDANGNRIAVRMPSGAVHHIEHTSLDQQRSYTPPEGASLAHDYDRDRAPTTTTLMGGRAITSGYDGGARPTGSEYEEATVALAYADETGRPESVSRSAAVGGETQVSTFAYDGELLVSEQLSGTIDGSFAYTHDADLRPTAWTLTSDGHTVSTPIAYDADGLPTKVGPFALARNGPGGAISNISDGTTDQDFRYDSLGRPRGRTQAVAGRTTYDLDVAFDAVGRIARRTETVAGDVHTYTYVYDDDDQLLRVERDGQPFERYAYDENGNRTVRQVGDGPPDAATYDAQDRLERAGSTDYEFDVDGFMRKRGEDTFRYSARGELLNSTVGERHVTYGHDMLGRRITRTGPDGTRQYLYGDPRTPWRITATRATDGALTALRYDEHGLLVALERDGRRFYVATDQVGTPRVVTSESGAVVKVVGHDSYGVQTHDSNPSFELPLGFAGGLPDPVTGLVRFGLRDYDPESGRWTARDPVLYDGGQANLYSYVANEPVSRSDPAGLDWTEWGNTWLPTAGNFAAGFGSVLSFGLTDRINDATGASAFVDKCSGAYSAGEWGGNGLSLAFGGAHLGRNALHQGVKRVFRDTRTWGSVRSVWSRATGGLRSKGQQLHHWLIPQRWAEVNAGFNYMPISAGLNMWMGSTAFRRIFAEGAFRGVVLGIYGAPATTAVGRARQECGCQ